MAAAHDYMTEPENDPGALLAEMDRLRAQDHCLQQLLERLERACVTVVPLKRSWPR